MGLRIVLFIVGTLLGVALGWELFDGHQWMVGLSAATGFLMSILVFAAEMQWRKLPFALNLWGGIGLLTGLVVAGAIGMLTGLVGIGSHSLFSMVACLALFLAVPYWGMSIGLRYGQEGWGMPPPAAGIVENSFTPKLLDTSVIIDGRIADLCETGFIEGSLVVPQFILQELQHISDSSDGLKRARGRRGLDILNVIQKMVNIRVEIVEDDFPHVKEVDTKLIELAKKMDAKVLTNDFNLNKVAGIQGVKVLNINDLCNALKPVVLPGEAIKVFVLKEGKENGQGIAYLDDGTMVVVDHAKRWIGKNVDVVVTSVLQTSAGRMIFTRIKEETESEELSFARV
ncbi:MAG: PIN/TRAM domain-containing protein [Nitrospirales bacterium]|nr:TRAM domain-containing protein [Nitrospirales bacterium]